MVLMGIWGTPAFKAWVAIDLQWFINIPKWPGLHGFVMQVAPIVTKPVVYAASYKWDFFGYAGTAMLISAIITMFVLRISPSTGVKVFSRTMKQLSYSLITIMSVLGSSLVSKLFRYVFHTRFSICFYWCNLSLLLNCPWMAWCISYRFCYLFRRIIWDVAEGYCYPTWLKSCSNGDSELAWRLNG